MPGTVAKLTNTGDAMRVVYSFSGALVAIKPGQSIDVELSQATIAKMHALAAKGAPLKIGQGSDPAPVNTVAKVPVAPPTAEPPSPPVNAEQWTAGQVLAQVQDMPYDVLLAHTRRLVGADKLPPRPIKAVMITALKKLAATPAE